MTPLIRSLRRAWPLAQIDALVFRGTAGVLEGNPDLNRLIVVPEHSSKQVRLRELRQLWNRYDLSLSCLPSDRARIYGWSASRRHLGMLAADESAAKMLLMNDAVRFDDMNTHTVSMGLQLADLAGITRYSEVVPPTAGGGLPPGIEKAFVVLHPFPKFNYKMWTEAGWSALEQVLQDKGYQVLLTGSNEAEEVAYCQRLAVKSGALCLAGKLSLAQTADLLRGAKLFVGPDTVVTHLAAACGIPTVALFGPSNPVKWGPWPTGHNKIDSPWQLVGSARHSNVMLLQGSGDCVPCRLEGCDRHLASWSRCLQEMPAARVINAALDML
ncbi:glycosyltransferase family 9 protein [Rhodoferax antarcticus]|uniref:glycosyltransferase family 9 protein n=1 Tax=Rhodoferax antarcticus TaxID=81479 RepID=UPI002223F067|nr:glycosyltransferase family 9 protein [Rhodoferax antarcticus]